MNLPPNHPQRNLKSFSVVFLLHGVVFLYCDNPPPTHSERVNLKRGKGDAGSQLWREVDPLSALGMEGAAHHVTLQKQRWERARVQMPLQGHVL